MSAYGGELFQSSFIDYEVKRRRRFVDQNEPEVFMRYYERKQRAWKNLAKIMRYKQKNQKAGKDPGAMIMR